MIKMPIAANEILSQVRLFSVGGKTGATGGTGGVGGADGIGSSIFLIIFLKIFFVNYFFNRLPGKAAGKQKISHFLAQLLRRQIF